MELSAEALAALRAQCPISELKDERVWLNPRTGEPWSTDAQIRKTLWQPACKRTEVEYRNPYQVRHTYASALLTAGANPWYVASQVGQRKWRWCSGRMASSSRRTTRSRNRPCELSAETGAFRVHFPCILAHQPAPSRQKKTALHLAFTWCRAVGWRLSNHDPRTPWNNNFMKNIHAIVPHVVPPHSLN